MPTSLHKIAFSALLALTVSLSPVLMGCGAKDEKTNITSSPSSVAPFAEKPPVETGSVSTDAGEPIAGAKALVEKAHTTKKFSEMSELFTNETAAAFSLPVFLGISLVAGMGEAFSNMGDSLTKLGGEKAQPSEKDKKKLEDMKKMNADLKVFSKKYGLDTLSPMAKPDEAKIKALAKDGRAMLKELGTILETSGSDVGEMTPTNEFLSVDEIDFKVLSPTEVKLTPKDPKKAKDLPPSATAKFEDGAWRLSLGTFDEIMQDMQTKSSGGMGAPGGSGMGMPGGSGTTP